MTIALKPLGDPMKSAQADWIRALERTQSVTPDSTRSLPVIIAELAAVQGQSPALIGETASLTYGDLDRQMNRYGHWARGLGLTKGDRLALFLPNQPDYAAIWLGLARIGIVTALINTQLTGAGLAHCLAESGAKHVIADATGADLLAACGYAGKIWVHGRSDEPPTALMLALAAMPTAPVQLEAPIALRDLALLIFTSGTTGRPKAARVSHYRVTMWSTWFAAITEAAPDDRLYDCLPMYHSIGGVTAIGAMLVAGGAVIVRDGFSARRFWADVTGSGATIFQYIGELCRYLLTTEPVPHGLRLCIGNGLRAEVWTEFAARFAIPRIIEFYAATEGSFSLFNLEGHPGSIGRIPRFMAPRAPVALVAFDEEREQPVRDSAGRCRRCAPGEIGEAIGRLAQDGAGTRFEGYLNAAESERKILRNVFAPGDSWFRTGDLMRQDKAGFFYFVDRIGDTFRWKGENVATSDVAAALMAARGVTDAVVYGVKVPQADGRAGMAAIRTDANLDLVELHAALAARLPRYARPLVLRLVQTLDTTGTFRPKKSDLIKEGFDPGQIDDPLFIDDGSTFVPLDVARYALIVRGEVRL
jgi:fatty-acyl-CoA synthase